MYRQRQHEHVVGVLAPGSHLFGSDVVIPDDGAAGQVVLVETLFAGEEVDVAGHVPGGVVHDEDELPRVLLPADYSLIQLALVFGLVAGLVHIVQFFQEFPVHIFAEQHAE